ncbi:class I SAM-dependent DNA methyltransferase [Leptothoe kymatousa]|uniref:site-specific DNA-methyltransferase (adenine-specific) n=1 Tax=Leptothoe kymatousa TAU-MAC 1615 TaxID=2364775 RepID=A0ABS5Y609_9CYAN|nr:N-6 DNA methylase [Leptothoe kymatousa]MBT9313206.1 N-6 DNA methylase [Leptothoe kymatousa TAU-MAC 1615]
MSLSTTIKSIQDIMRKDDGVDGDAQRIGQLTWMLFLKVLDQREEEWEESKKDYKSPIPEKCRWRNWAAHVPEKNVKNKPKNTGKLIGFVNNTLFPTLRELSGSKDGGESENKEIGVIEDPLSNLVSKVFEDSNNYMKSGNLMLEVIGKLNEEINFLDFTTRQNLGNIYEQILNDLRSAGNAGEFYTPRAITKVMVQQVNPRLSKREVVMDPACGTGGFLTATIDHLRAQLPKNASKEDYQAIEKSIVGFEKKQLPHLLCTTNLLLHNIELPNQADRRNTLAWPWDSWPIDEAVDCVVTNPPFGGMEDEGVGSDYPDGLQTRETSDMFITLIVEKLLRDGGRAAVVLPDGFLFGEGIKSRVKKLLMETCNLHTIIRLPNGVFAPYTSIKTNLLFFTKGKPTETIWFYEHPYPKGRKSYSKTKPIRLEEFSKEKSWWGQEENDFSERQESEHVWKLDFKKKKQDAETKAKPHWDKAQDLNNQASDIENQIRDLRKDLRKVTESKKRALVESQISDLHTQVEQLRLKARDAQDSGDLLYWPIYNLDIKNPNILVEEEHDPDALLDRYKVILSDIEETHELLKIELGTAIAHHLQNMEDK